MSPVGLETPPSCSVSLLPAAIYRKQPKRRLQASDAHFFSGFSLPPCLRFRRRRQCADLAGHRHDALVPGLSSTIHEVAKEHGEEHGVEDLMIHHMDIAHVEGTAVDRGYVRQPGGTNCLSPVFSLFEGPRSPIEVKYKPCRPSW